MSSNSGSNPWAAGLGALGNIAGSFVSGAISGHNASKLMKKQAALNYAYARKAALNSPSWNREGLETAGYNPMLAVQNATSGANSSWSGLNNAGSSDLGDLGTTAISNAQSFQHLENETRQTIANSGQAFATAENQKADAANKRAENPYISKRAESEIGKLEQDTAYTKALQDNIKVEQDLQRELANIDFAGRKYGSDTSYNATTYHANKLKEIADEHSPSGRSESFRNYAGGVSDVLRGASSFLPWNGSSSTTTFDKNGNVTSHKHTNSKKHR